MQAFVVRLWSLVKPENPTLLLDRPVDELPVVSDRGWNRVANGSTWLSVLVWWLAVQLVGLAAWPLTVVALPRFRDRGSPWRRQRACC